MRNLAFFIVLLSFGLVVCGQDFTDFSEAEKQLIDESSMASMRVYQKANKTDSLVLKAESIPIQPDDRLAHNLARRMLLSVMKTGGVGIAAPQVGINRRLIVVQRYDKPHKPFDVFINPLIIWESDLMQLGPEGDLSFEERGQVMRNYAIRIQYQDGSGEVHEEMLEGFTAVIYQHERDHLDGILLIDRIEEQKTMEFIPIGENSNLFYKKK